MDDTIRLGRVSAIDYDKGMISVLYTDRDESATDYLPVLSFNGEYKMPAVGSYVAVAHLSNGSAAGIVLGNYWNEANRPAVSGKGVYRKEFAPSAGEAFLQYSGGTILLSADNIKLTTSAGSTTVAAIIQHLEE